MIGALVAAYCWTPARSTEPIWFGSSADRSSGGQRHLPWPGHHSSFRLRPRPGSPAAQFTLHAAAYCEGRVNMLFLPLSTSQTTPCSRPTESNAVGVRVRFDAHRLLQRRSRQPAGQCTRSITASATRSSSVCGWPRATRSCHIYTHFVALVTNPSTNHLQTDAFCLLWSGSSVYI